MLGIIAENRLQPIHFGKCLIRRLACRLGICRIQRDLNLRAQGCMHKSVPLQTLLSRHAIGKNQCLLRVLRLGYIHRPRLCPGKKCTQRVTQLPKPRLHAHIMRDLRFGRRILSRQ